MSGAGCFVDVHVKDCKRINVEATALAPHTDIDLQHSERLRIGFRKAAADFTCFHLLSVPQQQVLHTSAAHPVNTRCDAKCGTLLAATIAVSRAHVPIDHDASVKPSLPMSEWWTR